MNFDKFSKVQAVLKTYEAGFIPKGKYQVQVKLDGANAGIIKTAEGLSLHSRNQHLGILKPEELGTFGGLSGFVEFVRANFKHFWDNLREGDHVYGEWLVPHTIAYPEEFYKKFYVFDDNFLHLVSQEHGVHATPRIGDIEISEPLFESGVDLVKRIMVMAESYAKSRNHKTEGVVLARYNQHHALLSLPPKDVYSYTKDTDRFKVVFPEFKEEVAVKWNKAIDLNTPVELEMIKDYPIRAYEKVVEKVKDMKSLATIDNSCIGPVLGLAWNDYMQEFFVDSVKKHKMPTVRFKILQSEFQKRIREMLLNQLSFGELPAWAVTAKVQEND